MSISEMGVSEMTVSMLQIYAFFILDCKKIEILASHFKYSRNHIDLLVYNL